MLTLAFVIVFSTMRFLVRLLVSLLAAMPTLTSAASMAGTVVQTVSGGAGQPMEGVTVRLCSVNGIATTTADRRGRFSFADVEPGIYYVTVFQKGHVRPRSRRIQLSTPDAAALADFQTAITDPVEAAPCDRDSTSDCEQTDFMVDYGNSNALAQAQLTGIVQSRQQGSGKPPKPYGTFTVEIFSQGKGKRLATVRTGRDGRFSFSNLAAGEYDLTASAPGFRTVGITDFLVPRGNATSIVLETAPQRQVRLFTDCMTGEI